jgi:hypothetical protein
VNKKTCLNRKLIDLSGTQILYPRCFYAGDEVTIMNSCHFHCLSQYDVRIVSLPVLTILGLTMFLNFIAIDYIGFRAKYFHRKQEEIQKYSRRLLTQRLAGIFDNLTSNKTYDLRAT